MQANITITSNLFTQEAIDDLNHQFENYSYKLTTQMGLAFPPEVFLVVVELLRTVGYSAAYDILKAVTLSIIEKIKVLKKETKTQTKMTLINNGKMTELTFSFELSENQQNDLVDAAIKRILSDN